jgi:hypothetical protein
MQISPSACALGTRAKDGTNELSRGVFTLLATLRQHVPKLMSRLGEGSEAIDASVDGLACGGMGCPKAAASTCAIARLLAAAFAMASKFA